MTIRVYTDQFEDLQVELDGRPLTPGTSIPCFIDNVDVEAWVREMLQNLAQELGNLEVA